MVQVDEVAQVDFFVGEVAQGLVVGVDAPKKKFFDDLISKTSIVRCDNPIFRDNEM